MSTALSFDFVVVGAGIAGASAAYHLAQQGRTLVLERESQPGYHSTGRSAAQYIATYGTPQVRALTTASRAFFDAPPPGFCSSPILRQRAVMTLALPGQEALFEAAWQLLQASSPSGRRLSADEACALVPVLRRERVLQALLEPDSFDMDVHALHQGFLRGLRREGAAAGSCLVTQAEVKALQFAAGRWRVQAGDQVFLAPVLVNAAGAWCDELARRAGVAPIGLVPKRRSALTLKAPAGPDCSHWPLVVDAAHSFYFKPDAGALLASPANADPTEPQDVQPEELDIATALHHLQENTTLALQPTHRWAGLRSFVADGDLVAGFDAQAPGFFWCSGQGGYGIQTSAAMGQACAALACGQPLPASLLAFGLTQAMLSPARLEKR